MKLLIVTQKVDATDSNLGFFVEWIKKIAGQADVTVIANESGWRQKMEHVTVLSLGKEKGASRFARFLRYQTLLFRTLPMVDGVFFHMCPEYVLAAHFLPKCFGKKSVLWYTHKQVSARLRVASWLVNKIYTASKESCRLRSKKVEVKGHGIDTDRFVGNPDAGQELRLVSVGRITPVKDIETVIRGFFLLKEKYPDAVLTLLGDAITDADRAYEEKLRSRGGGSFFSGPVPHYQLPSVLADNTVFVHASKTGSMDKAVLEALAAGLPVFTSSEAFNASIPGVHTFEEGNPEDLARVVTQSFRKGELSYNAQGSEWVKQHHGLDGLVKKIVDFYV